MDIICEKCNARLSIPDDKIPSGQRAAISCPKCKNRITLNVPVSGRKNLPPEVGEKPGPVVNNADSDSGYEDDDASLDFFEEGVRLALIMGSEPHHAEKLGQTADELGYKHVLANNTREAISKMRLHHFDMILLSDGFDGIDLAQSPILQHINNLSMSVRRRVFLALVADEFKTMDHMMAFAMSANMVINGGDLDRLTSIVQHAISDNEKFYKVFTDTMVEVGKA
jgi:hypothetical protein